MTTASLATLVPIILGIAGLLYPWLALRVLRETREAEGRTIAYFLFLVGAMTLGSAFTFGTSDPILYGVGRILSFTGAGFVPVALFYIYRRYTVGPPSLAVLALLSVIPAATVVLAMTNPLHQLLWIAQPTADGFRFSAATEHPWFSRVFAPYAYGLFGYSVVALASRLPDIAHGHRPRVRLFLFAALLPLAVSFANTYLGIGPYDFPFTSLTLTLLLPFYWWLGVRLQAQDFSPLAYRTLLDHMLDPIIVVDREQRVVSVNRPAQALLSASERELAGRPLSDERPAAKLLRQYLAQRDLAQTVRLQGNSFYEVYTAPVTGPAGQDQGTMLVCRDVSDRKRALRRLADSEHLIRTLIENSSNGVLRFARDDAGRFRCSFANRAAEGYLFSGEAGMVGMPIDKLELLEPRRLLERFDHDRQAETGVNYEICVERDDVECWLRVIGEPVGGDFSVTLIDITQRKQQEHKILQDAMRDPLTGVLNRRGFDKQATDSLGASASAAVLYLDLNHFKGINDRFGHETGDAVLKAFGHRLEYCLRPEDILARLGGDEFAVVLPDVGVDDAKHVARRLVETAGEAYIIRGEEICCAASVGIALKPEHGSELWPLVGIADQAMYNVKSMGQAAANDRAAWVDAAVAS